MPEYEMPTVRPHLAVHSDHVPEVRHIKVEMTLRDHYAVLSVHLAYGVEVMLFTPITDHATADAVLLALSDAAEQARLSL